MTSIATVIYIGGPKDGETERFPADRLREIIVIATVEDPVTPVYKRHAYRWHPYDVPFVPSIMRVYTYEGIVSRVTANEIDQRAREHDADLFERSQR